jgi:hypothetical protein
MGPKGEHPFRVTGNPVGETMFDIEALAQCAADHPGEDCRDEVQHQLALHATPADLAELEDFLRRTPAAQTGELRALLYR